MARPGTTGIPQAAALGMTNWATPVPNFPPLNPLGEGQGEGVSGRRTDESLADIEHNAVAGL
jgi:hypothetical protein